MTAIASVENLLYGGRTLVGFTDEGERIAGWPEVAHESIRAINHLTSHGPIPAPTAYRILGDAQAAISEQGYRTNDSPSLFDDEDDPR